MIIGICGASSSGKSTVAKEAKKRLENEKNKSVLVIPLDNFYKEDQLVPRKNGLPDYDHPDSINLERLESTLHTISIGQRAYLPQYNKITKETTETEITGFHELIIVEGIYSFQTSQLQELISKKIFLDIDEQTMRKRRLARHDGQDDEDFFEKIVLPGYQMIQKQKPFADTVINACVPLEDMLKETYTTIESFINGNL